MSLPQTSFGFHVPRPRTGHIAFAAAFVALSIATALLPAGERLGNAAEGTLTVAPQVDSIADSTVCFSEDCKELAPLRSAITTAQRDGKTGGLVASDDFSSTTLKTGDGGWLVYDYPDGTPRRPAKNVAVDGDFLNLTGVYQGGEHTGGGLEHRFNQKYGRWEVRARADKGAGFSPTILLWPETERWPDDGEIDLLESPRGNRQSAMAVLHNGVRNYAKSHAVEGNQSDWHTYSVDWTPNRITFYVDGVVQWDVTDKLYIPTTSAMHLAIQIDAGCAWIQCPNGETPPKTVMQIDWIKVYAPAP